MPRQFVLRAAASLSSLCLLAACGGTDGGGSTSGVGDRAASAPATTGDSLAGGQPTLPKPTPTPRPKASTVDAACPYIDTETVKDTIGQHLSRTTVTSTAPHPSCAFYRPDGGLAAEITVSEQANSIAAQNDALGQVGKDSNPVTGIGDYGVVAIVDDGALLAVTKGSSLVLIKINQKSSLEAREIAKAVVGAL